MTGCPHPAQPHPTAAGWARPITTTGTAAIRGLDVGADGTVYAAIQHAAPLTLGGAHPTPIPDPAGSSLVIAPIAATGAPRWTWAARATGGPIAVAGTRVVATLVPVAGEHALALGTQSLAVRGEPGVALVGLDAATGAIAWSQAIGATGWSLIAAIDADTGGDVVAVGSFAGSLRVGDQVVTSAGGSDGFAVRLDPAGKVRWLIRLGGEGADALTAVAIAPGRDGAIALAGSISGEADLRGTPLVAHNPRLASSDVAIALIDAGGAPAWGRVIGGDDEDVAAGVAIMAGGRIAVAATVRDVVHVGDETLVVRGTSDTLIAIHDGSGTPIAGSLIGGADYDGARGLIVAPDGNLVVSGWFSGVLRGPAGDLTAAGGDDAFVARVDREAQLISVEPITGDGREEVTGLAGSAAVIALGIGHTDGFRALGATVAAPGDPMGGVAIVVRPWWR